MSILSHKACGLGGLLLLVTGHCALAAPVNDAWSDRIVIPSLSGAGTFTASVPDAWSATSDPADPATPCLATQIGAGTGANSLWYEYTTGAAAEYVNLSTQGSYYYTGVNTVSGQVTMTYAVVNVFSGNDGALRMLAGGCNATISGYGGYALIGGLRLEPNTSYSIEVAAYGALSTTNPPPAPATSMPMLAFTLSSAPVYSVDRTDDPLPAPGTCDAGTCSIRAAINAANAAPGAVLIPPGDYTMTTTTSNDDANADGDFDVATSMSIRGAGRAQTIIHAAPADRVFDFINPAYGVSGSGQTDALADIALIGPGDPAAGGSGAYTFGGALVRARAASQAGLIALERAELAHGYSTSLGESGSFQTGGAAQLATHAQLIDCDVHDNTARNGGGIAFMTGSSGSEMDRSTIHDNVASNTNASTSSATNGGGGLLVAAAVVLVDSTVANNRANGDGGGIASGNIGNASLPKMQIRSSTIAGNVADADTDGIGAGGGLRVARTAGVILYNDILYGNRSGAATSDDCTGATPAASSPSLTGHNLVGSYSGAACAFDVAHNDLLGVDPLLGALADNGGATTTLALGAGSPALDAADPAGCNAADGRVLDVDQRDRARVAGAACDIGAYERNGAIAAPQALQLDIASDSGNSSSDGLTNVTAPLIDGSCAAAPASYTVHLVVDGGAATSTDCNAAAFQAAIGPLADGAHAIRAYALDTDGAPSEQSAALTITIDTQTSVAIGSGPADPSTSADATFEFSAEAGDEATCTIDGGTPAACTSPVTYGSLVAGVHTFAVDALDAAGNHANDSRSWTILAPAAPAAPVLDSASDSGASDTDGVTNALLPVLNGSCEQDGDVIAFVDGATPLAGTTICAANGYSLAIDGLGEGVHALAAIASRNGVASAPGASVSITIDRSAPSAPLVSTMSPVPPTFTLQGTAEVGAQVVVTQGATVSCSVVADAGGNWSCAISTSTDLALDLVATDLAGNASPTTHWIAALDRLFADGFDG